MASDSDFVLRDPQRFARGDTQLHLDEVEASHFFSHRVLDLQPCIDLEEVDPLTVI